MARLDGTIPKAIKEKAIKDSIEMFGKQNVSGLIAYLIKNHKSKK